jgi:SHS2 domain-containing protein
VYRWVEHTAELQLSIQAATEREVFEDALGALGELWGAGGGEVERRAVSVDAPDRPALLAAWMEELVFLAESEGFVGARVEALELSPERVEARVAGALSEPPPIVKAITYHDLVFERAGGGYVARVVLDV